MLGLMLGVDSVRPKEELEKVIFKETLQVEISKTRKWKSVASQHFCPENTKGSWVSTGTEPGRYRQTDVQRDSALTMRSEKKNSGVQKFTND